MWVNTEEETGAVELRVGMAPVSVKSGHSLGGLGSNSVSLELPPQHQTFFKNTHMSSAHELSVKAVLCIKTFLHQPFNIKYNFFCRIVACPSADLASS